VSAKDPKSCLEFSFLPEKTPLRMLTWPKLEELSSSRHEEPPASPSSVQEPESVTEEEQVEAEEDITEQPPAFTDEETPRKSHAPAIQPLKNIASHHIDLRSPICGSPSLQSELELVTPKREAKAQSDQALQVQAKFKALVEGMRSTGKVKVSISELEGQLKVSAAKTGEAIENPSSYIAKAGDAQILAIDKATNSVRFRNRAFSNASINYV
jgi:hypothetical protein